ncbi:MAG: hypothetical protein MK066_02200 [Crocinitomicaceae bacterium]|nr:hypothetical protein [Crocinitomicaceae bacterium]
MKKTLLILVIATVSSSVFSQKSTEKASSLKLNSIGVELGVNLDIYQNMNLQTMHDLTQNPALLSRDLTDHNATFYRNSFGGRFGINASFTPANASREIRFGASYIVSEPMISYDRNEMNGNSHSIIYCNMVNEVNLNGAYLFKKSPVIAPWLNFYAGVGTSLGSSFNNQMVVMENTNTIDQTTEESTFTHETDFYASKSSFYGRIYAPLGISATILRKVRFGIEGTIGTGVQSVYGGKTYFMPFSGGLKTTLAYVL